MFQVSLTLPVQQHNNASNMVTITGICRTLAQQHGGYTSQPVTGGWIDEENGQLYTDESLLVWTFVDGIEAVNDIKAQAQQWAIDLQQIELLVTVQTVDVSFIKGTRAQAQSAA